MTTSMKHDAIVAQGIPIHERVPIPDDLIPADSRVEIDAKIHAGYCKCRYLATNVFDRSEESGIATDHLKSHNWQSPEHG